MKLMLCASLVTDQRRKEDGEDMVWYSCVQSWRQADSGRRREAQQLEMR